MTEALLFSVLEVSLRPHARTDGQVATYLTDRRKVPGVGDLAAPVLGWAQTHAGAELSLPARTWPDYSPGPGEMCLGALAGSSTWGFALAVRIGYLILSGVIPCVIFTVDRLCRRGIAQRLEQSPWK